MKRAQRWVVSMQAHGPMDANTAAVIADLKHCDLGGDHLEGHGFGPGSIELSVRVRAANGEQARAIVERKAREHLRREWTVRTAIDGAV